MGIFLFRMTMRRLIEPVKVIEAPVRAYVAASLPPGSMAGHNPYESALMQMDAVSYRSMPNQ